MRITKKLVNGTEMIIVGTSYGLVPEGQKLQELLLKEKPRSVALLMAPEDLHALQAGVPDVEEDIIADAKNELAHLSSFGELQPVPSPDLAAVLDYCNESGADLMAIDLDDHVHSELYLKHVGMFDLFRRGRAKKLQGKLKLKDGETLESWVDRYEGTLLDVPGIRKFEEERLKLALAILPKATNLVLIHSYLWPLLEAMNE